MGVVVREGTPLPDISTPEAVKAALIKAKTIAYTDPKLGGTSVEHLMKFAERFGIKDEVIRKGVISTGGNDAAAKVADGKADIAIVPITDIHAKDAKLVGPLPEPIQLWTVYAAAIPHQQRRSRRRARVRRGVDRDRRCGTAGSKPAGSRQNN